MDYYDRYSRFREDGNIKIVPYKSPPHLNLNPIENFDKIGCKPIPSLFKSQVWY